MILQEEKSKRVLQAGERLLQAKAKREERKSLEKVRLRANFIPGAWARFGVRPFSSRSRGSKLMM